MKTQKNTTPTLPSPVKFSIYLIAVALVCFLNWNALKASDFPNGETRTLKARLEAALVPVAEEELVLEEWMLAFDNNLVVSEETVIGLEDWMLTFNNNLVASEEPEIALEDWMLTFDNNLMADDEEPEIVLADWMLEVPDSAPAIEDWMVNTETWAHIEFLATK